MRIIKSILLALVMALVAVASASASTLTVCASGCTYTLAQFQNAIDAAVPGDTIKLQSGATFTGDFVLRMKTPNASNLYITITTGVNSSGGAVTVGPATDVRTAPSYSSVLAKIVPNSNNGAAFRTVNPGETGSGCSSAPCVSSYYTLVNLEIGANTYAGNSLIVLGSQAVSTDCSLQGGTGSCGSYTGGNTQDQLTEEPHHFILDRLYMHGNALTGQERALQISAHDVTLKNSYLADFKAQADKQAIWTDNSSGTITITNNYIEGAGENFLAGGDVPRMNRDTTVSGTATTTSMTLANAPADFLAVGMGISFVSGGAKKYTHVTSIAGSVIGIEDVGFTPTTGGAVNYSVVPHGLVFTYNHLIKPVAWRNPIVPTPQSVTTQTATTGGTLAAGTYSYRVVARMTTAGGQVARSTASSEVSRTTTGSTSTVTISWAAVTGATSYYIYGRSAGGENVRFSVTAPTVTFTDTGAAGTTENVPTSTGTVWAVKNLFELKKMYTATIEYNLMDYVWNQAQTGYPILFTVLNNSNGVDGNDSTVVRDITFRYNRVRHSAGIMQLTGRPADGDIGDRTRDFTISHNIFEDVGNAWGGSVDLIMITTGTNSAFFAPQKRGPLNILINHNTFLGDQGKSSILMDLYKSGEAHIVENFDFKDNLLRKVNSGLRAYNSGGLMAEGNTSWAAATDSGTSTWLNNVVVGATCSLYPGAPSSTFCPPEATFQAAFSDFAGGNYTVVRTWNTSATDGTAIGADPSLSAAGLAIAETGNNAGGATTPPTITTTTLPNGVVGQSYNGNGYTLTATGGSPPYTWGLASGSVLPAGLTRSGAVISGIPTAPDVTSFTVTVTGSDSAVSSRALSITIDDAPEVSNDRPGRVDYVMVGIFSADSCDLIDDPINVGDLCLDLTTLNYKKAVATSPAVTWKPIVQPSVNGLFFTYNANNPWTNMPVSPGDEFFGTQSLRFYTDLTSVTECRLWTRIASAMTGTSFLYIEYSANGGTTFSALGTTAQTPKVDLTTLVNNYAVSPWTPIVEAAKTDVVLRVWGIAGTVQSPMFRNTGFTCR